MMLLFYVIDIFKSFGVFIQLSLKAAEENRYKYQDK